MTGLLALRPGDVEARNNRGLALMALGRSEDALAEFDRVLAAAAGSCRRPCQSRQRAAARRAKWTRRWKAMTGRWRCSPDLPEALASRANLLLDAQGRCGRRDRRSGTAGGGHARLSLCAGRPAASENACRRLARFRCERRRSWTRACARASAWSSPLSIRACRISPADLLACARIYAARQISAADHARRSAARRPRGKIRVGYLCGEFRAQATMYLAAGLFEHHDRTRFEMIAFDNSREDSSADAPAGDRRVRQIHPHPDIARTATRRG